ncbi:MAG: DUF262 domain-containing protein, partial [Erysipelotrichaceae bacterium]|nr:DUF262 domain-containing protein [Erysipelotrichaceae bacterium]
EDGTQIDGWEVIDGQQRLTTLYIMIHYLAKAHMKVDSLIDVFGKELFTIRYETRPGSAAFLRNIRQDSANIDYYHMYQAYKSTESWFTDQEHTRDYNERNQFLQALLGRIDVCSVQVIWYQVEEQINSLNMFTRLNIGKIQLTNAELIKALFLSESSFTDQGKETASHNKIEIALLWDEMEQGLHDEDFWAFITNVKPNSYINRIELLFDMIAGKKSTEPDPLFTFLYFLKTVRGSSAALWQIWLDIEQYYMTLGEWFKSKNLYHKIGYLIAVGENLKTMLAESLTTAKDMFEESLDLRISASVNVDVEELDYEKDRKQIERVLLLFNVESIRRNAALTEKYPFRFHKSTAWSLEHIHAQNSDGLDRTKKDIWLRWLQDHRSLMADLTQEITSQSIIDRLMAFITEIDQVREEKLTWERFSELSERIISVFTENGDGSEDIHSITNMALLSQADNTSLSNAVFELKRRKIIEMDKEGQYIPVCTRRIFLKYYNPNPAASQIAFWGRDDRQYYIAAMKNELNAYLPQDYDAAGGSR